MEMNVSTPTILFPAISLLFLAYTNRFLHLSALIRQLHANYIKNHRANIREQLQNLTLRLRLIRYMQAFGILSLLLCLSSVSCHFFNVTQLSIILFGAAVVTMAISLIISLYEVLISGGALTTFLHNMADDDSQK